MTRLREPGAVPPAAVPHDCHGARPGRVPLHPVGLLLRPRATALAAGYARAAAAQCGGRFIFATLPSIPPSRGRLAALWGGPLFATRPIGAAELLLAELALAMLVAAVAGVDHGGSRGPEAMAWAAAAAAQAHRGRGRAPGGGRPARLLAVRGVLEIRNSRSYGNANWRQPAGGRPARLPDAAELRATAGAGLPARQLARCPRDDPRQCVVVLRTPAAPRAAALLGPYRAMGRSRGPHRRAPQADFVRTTTH